MARVVHSCCCGSPHTVSNEYYEWLSRHTDTVLIGNLKGLWRVPRTYLAFHLCVGISRELPRLAERFGWEEVQTGFHSSVRSGYRWWPAPDRNKEKAA